MKPQSPYLSCFSRRNPVVVAELVEVNYDITANYDPLLTVNRETTKDEGIYNKSTEINLDFLNSNYCANLRACVMGWPLVRYSVSHFYFVMIMLSCFYEYLFKTIQKSININFFNIESEIFFV